MNKNTSIGIFNFDHRIFKCRGIVSSAAAQTGTSTISQISYPVAELGNCADQAACKTYCDKTENIDACLNFAEKNNLMSSAEIQVARNFKALALTGPGSCAGKDACDAYCSDSSIWTSVSHLQKRII